MTGEEGYMDYDEGSREKLEFEGGERRGGREREWKTSPTVVAAYTM